MNKLLISIFTIVALGLSFASCSDDDEKTYDGQPGKAAAGVYTGSWTMVQIENGLSVEGTEKTGDGTLEIAASEDGGYYANVTVTSADLSLTGTDVVNISYADDGFVFLTDKATEGVSGAIGTKAGVRGRIESDGSVLIYFEKGIKSGRKTYTYKFTFVGKK